PPKGPAANANIGNPGSTASPGAPICPWCSASSTGATAPRASAPPSTSPATSALIWTSSARSTRARSGCGTRTSCPRASARRMPPRPTASERNSDLTFEHRPATTSVMEPFDALIDAHGAHVWRVCRALARPEDAADAWQETFLAALRTYGEARPANPRAWLLGIAHHKCMDTHRRRFREAIPIAMDDDARRAWAAPDRVDDGDLWRVVAELPAKPRPATWAGFRMRRSPRSSVAALRPRAELGPTASPISERFSRSTHDLPSPATSRARGCPRSHGCAANWSHPPGRIGGSPRRGVP